MQASLNDGVYPARLLRGETQLAADTGEGSEPASGCGEVRERGRRGTCVYGAGC